MVDVHSSSAVPGVIAPDPRRWQALALVCVAFFMTILDVSIVNVALPSIARALHFSASGLQWVVTAYAITFGGFLLLGGRAADLLGRRRIFLVGVALFSAASLVCGLASVAGVLVAARAVQGTGAAIISSATLSIITTTFSEGSERNKALGIWGAMGGGGAAVGVLLGGVLTQYAGWEWIFFVNVPVGAAVLLLTRAVVRESKVESDSRSYDAVGAVCVTAGLALLVYAISKAPNAGWGATSTVVLLVVSVALLGFFVAWEARAKAPIMPLGIFRIRTLAGANAVSVLLGAVIFSNFFLITLYVQNVLHYSAIKAGLTFLATAGTVVVIAGLAQALTTRIGARYVMAIGLALLAGGMIYYSQIPVHGAFLGDLLPGYLFVGFGLPFAFIATSIAALEGVPDHQAGIASGLLNTSQQIGGALGLAIVSSVAISRADRLLKLGRSPAAAFTSGYALAFWVLAGIGVAGVLCSLTLVGPGAAGAGGQAGRATA